MPPTSPPIEAQRPADDTSIAERLAALRDVHYVYRAQRVDESPEAYQKDLNETWAVREMQERQRFGAVQGGSDNAGVDQTHRPESFGEGIEGNTAPPNDSIEALLSHPKTLEYLSRAMDGEDVDVMLQGNPMADNIRLALALGLQRYASNNRRPQPDGSVVFEQPKRESAEDHKKSNESGEQSLEHILQLSNVQHYKAELISRLTRERDDPDLRSRLKSVLYNMLTRRPEYVEAAEHAGGEDVYNLQMLQARGADRAWYRQTIDRIGDAVRSQSMTWDSNPAWFGINTRPEAIQREGILNKKIYATIPSGHHQFIEKLPALAVKLRELAVANDDDIKVKVPGSLSGFLSHNDSIVIHFKNEQNAEHIQKTLDVWMHEHAIQVASRAMGRTTLAADSADSSFSDIVAQAGADMIIEKLGSQTDVEALADEAITHVIAQSQVPPKSEKSAS